MAQNITLQGASYSDVPSVELPKTGGGTASFTDVTDTTAGANDVAAGKYFYTAAGVKTEGTSTGGGGGGGLVYETGTYTPTNDAVEANISFANAHSSLPINIIFADTENNSASAGSNLYFTFDYWYEALGSQIFYSGSASYYALIRYASKSSSSLSSSGQNISSITGDSSASMIGYWVTTSGFKATTNNTSRYWRSGRTYKWIAVWKSTS